MDSTLNEYENSLNESIRKDEVVKATESQESSANVEQRSQTTEGEPQQIDEPTKRAEVPSTEPRQEPNMDRDNEADGVKVTDKVTVKFDENEGLTIISENLNYRIATVEHETIGGLEFDRYKTNMGEEFLHIPSENKLIPPYETPWYALRPNTEVYLDLSYKTDRLLEAISKAGGEVAFRKEMKERGAIFSNGNVYRHLHQQRDGLRADKLISVLKFLGRNLDEPNKHIRAIGHCRAIENPKLPFRLNNNDGARLMGARYSDGTNSASKGRGPRFNYANNDAGQRNRIVESLKNVFGGANILNREYNTGEVAKVRTSSDIVGYVLMRAGAVTGEIVDKNPHIPVLIREGSLEMKREWLIQASGDEGYVWPQKGKVCIGRAVEASSVLSKEMTDRLDGMSWQDKFINRRFVCGIRPCKDLPGDIYGVVEGHPPNLLLEEKKMLSHFDIEARMYPIEMHRGKYGDYSAHWTLQTETREDGRRFAEKIGFPQERKQKKAVSVLRLDR